MQHKNSKTENAPAGNFILRKRSVQPAPAPQSPEESLFRRYFLGTLPAAEADELDIQACEDEDLSERMDVAEEQLITDYLDRLLPPQETERFERNYFSVPSRARRVALHQEIRAHARKSQLVNQIPPFPVLQPWWQDALARGREFLGRFTLPSLRLTPAWASGLALLLAGIAIGLWQFQPAASVKKATEVVAYPGFPAFEGTPAITPAPTETGPSASGPIAGHSAPRTDTPTAPKMASSQPPPKAASRTPGPSQSLTGRAGSPRQADLLYNNSPVSLVPPAGNIKYGANSPHARQSPPSRFAVEPGADLSLPLEWRDDRPNADAGVTARGGGARHQPVAEYELVVQRKGTNKPYTTTVKDYQTTSQGNRATIPVPAQYIQDGHKSGTFDVTLRDKNTDTVIGRGAFILGHKPRLRRR